jgi:hypothetical protein
MVVTEAEQAGDHLAAEAGGRLDPGRSRGAVEERRLVAEAQRADELRVELRNRDRAGGAGRHARRLAGKAGDKLSELALGDRVVGPEGAARGGHQAARRDELDLTLGPGALRRGRERRRRGKHGDREHGEDNAPGHMDSIVRARPGL